MWWWRCPPHTRRHIQSGTRPVVVVSNDTCNEASEVVTVVPFTTQVKRPYPQQVPVIFEGAVSIALADQITSVPISELHEYSGELRDFQMDQIDRAIAVQLGFVPVETRAGSTVSKRDEEQ